MASLIEATKRAASALLRRAFSLVHLLAVARRPVMDRFASIGGFVPIACPDLLSNKAKPEIEMTSIPSRASDRAELAAARAHAPLPQTTRRDIDDACALAPPVPSRRDAADAREWRNPPALRWRGN